MKRILISNEEATSYSRRYSSLLSLPLDQAFDLLEGKLAKLIADELADIEVELTEGKQMLDRAKKLGIKPTKK